MADSLDTLPAPKDLAQIKSALRLELRKRRQALNPTQQMQASLFLLRHLMKVPQFMRARNVALYIANDGEIDPAPIAQQLWKMEKHCFLPVLRPDKRRDLWFVEYKPGAQLTNNRFGIPEPDFRKYHKMSTELLDVVLMPLVGFDRNGARLGMGGGFYDATFAFKQKKTAGKPVLIGLAHACQEVESLATAEWDIPLLAIASDKELIYTQR